MAGAALLKRALRLIPVLLANKAILAAPGDAGMTLRCRRVTVRDGR
jgi:hypothetical protein